jgi:hypothetical protein
MKPGFCGCWGRVGREGEGGVVGERERPAGVAAGRWGLPVRPGGWRARGPVGRRRCYSAARRASTRVLAARRASVAKRPLWTP